MASSGQEDEGGQPPGSRGLSGLWPLAGPQSQRGRSAQDVAQQLLPNLPRRAPTSQGQVAVDLSPLMAGDGNQEEALTISPQMASRMEEIRSLLRSMSNQQQQQHQHTHSHLAPPDPQAHIDPTHSPPHGHGHEGSEARGEGAGLPGLDMRGLVGRLQTSGVFFILLLLRFIYDHSLGVVVMLALGGTFYYVNLKLVQCIHQTAVREVGSSRLARVGYPLWLIIFLGINITLLYYSFRGQALWNTLRYQMPMVAEVDVWTLLWMVLVTDFVVKFATVASKCCVFLLPSTLLPHRRRGRYYMCVERVSQFYRLTLPILPWLHYLQDDQEISRWFAMATMIIYSIVKTFSLVPSAKEVIKALQRLRTQTSFGSRPAAEDLEQRGSTCPICQDEYKDPILLACKHVFCENCVSLWFDREKTCPMCRAQITDDPLWQDGSTTYFLQWY